MVMKTKKPIKWKRNDMMIRGVAEREICLQAEPKAGRPVLFLSAYCGNKKQEKQLFKMADKIVALLNEDEEVQALKI